MKTQSTFVFGMVFVLYLNDFPGTRKAFTYGFNSVSFGKPSILKREACNDKE